jgi:hypothetical protein
LTGRKYIPGLHLHSLENAFLKSPFQSGKCRPLPGRQDVAAAASSTADMK